MTKTAKNITDSRSFRATIIATILCAGVLAGIETAPAMVAAHGTLLGTLDAMSVLKSQLSKLRRKLTSTPLNSLPL
jgi:pyrroline-5-carboxylate reductase